MNSDAGSYELRPITAAEFDSTHPLLARAFLSDVDPAERDNDKRVVEYDRTLITFDEHEPVGFAAAFSRELTVPGGPLPAACVTMVGVAATHRRRGILSATMDRQLSDIHDRGELIATLWASEASIYGRYGYGPASWRHHTTVRVPATALRSDVDRGAGRLRLVAVDVARSALEQVYERNRSERVGMLSRSPAWWDVRTGDPESFRHGATSLQYVLHEDPAGEVDGYATYRTKGEFGPYGTTGELHLRELHATRTQALAALWGYLLEMDLVRTVDTELDDVASPLPLMVNNLVGVEQTLRDALWVRLVDVPGALAARTYACDIDVVIAVEDARCQWNTGRYRLRGGSTGAACERTEDEPDLTADVRALGAAYLGGTGLARLAAVGQLTEHRPGALAVATTAFSSDLPPWCPEVF